MCRRLVILLLCGLVGNVLSWREVFDQQLYENVLDEKLCDQQLELLSDHPLRYQFLDASAKIPSGILTGNLNDFGDYHQCLSIDGLVQEIQVQGKYCTILVPLQQEPIEWPSIPEWNITWPEIPELPDINTTLPELGPETVMVVDNYEPDVYRWAKIFADFKEDEQSRIFPAVTQVVHGVTLGVCVPKSCTARQALTHWTKAMPFLNITFNEYYCRLPGDKPFVAADYVAIVFLSIILLLSTMSTTYDLMEKFYFKRDPSEGSNLCRSFSVYTNTRRLLNFSSNPGALDCIDGIRAISMMWIVAGHTYSFTLLGYVHNQKYILEWMTDFSSTWISAAPITVDTFFLLTGLLVVYTTTGKLRKERFLPSLHLFYLNRFLRMFPLLAVLVLLSSSLIHHMADGPFWVNVAQTTQDCRTYWWAVLLHVQNYVNPLHVCMQQTWYLSVDTQLYILSPLILWWLWGHPRRAWIVLVAFTLLSLVGSSVISYLNNFSAALANFNRLGEFNDYVTSYYLNTLARAPPFVIGMIYGYLLVTYKDKKIRISKMNVCLLWVMTLLIMAFCLVSIYPVLQADHSAQWFDNFLNAYMRAMWAGALGWLIFACAKGYGGPINWLLSLRMWKLPARLSFAMYLVHVPLITVANGTWLQMHYFTPTETFYRFMSDLGLTFVASFVLCLMVDAPFSTLLKQMLGGNKKRPPKPKITVSTVNVVEDGNMFKTTL